MKKRCPCHITANDSVFRLNQLLGKLVFERLRCKFPVIARPVRLSGRGNPLAPRNQVTISAKNLGGTRPSGYFSVHFSSIRGIATTSLRTGFAMTAFFQTPICRLKGIFGAVKKQPAKNGGFQEWDPPLTFSVYFACGILFARKVNAPTTSSGNCEFPGDFFRAFLRRFLCCQLLEVVLVKVKTAGYQP